MSRVLVAGDRTGHAFSLLHVTSPPERSTPIHLHDREEETIYVLDGEPLSASTVDAVRAACIACVGIAMLTYWDVHKHIAGGELRRIVLADVKPLEVGIWAVFPTRTHMPARVRAFIDALRDRLLAGADPGSHETG